MTFLYPYYSFKYTYVDKIREIVIFYYICVI